MKRAGSPIDARSGKKATTQGQHADPASQHAKKPLMPSLDVGALLGNPGDRIIQPKMSDELDVYRGGLPVGLSPEQVMLRYLTHLNH